MTTRVETRPAPRHPAGGAPPASDAGDSGGGGPRWVELLRARDDIDAHLLTGRLAESSIETRTVKDRSAPGAWLYGGSNPWAPVVILVKALQLDEARMVLAEISWAQPTMDPSAPPETSSFRSHAVAWWALAIALGVAFTSIALVRMVDGTQSCEIPLVCSPSESAP